MKKYSTLKNLHTQRFMHKHKHILCISFARSNSQFISVHVSVCYGFLFFLAHIDHIRSHIARCERIEKARNYVYTDSSTSKTVFITDIIDISGAYMAMDMNGFSIKLKALYLLFSLAPFFHFILSLSLSLSYFLSVFLYFASARSQNSILGRIKWENSTFKSKGFYLSFFFFDGKCCTQSEWAWWLDVHFIVWELFVISSMADLATVAASAKTENNWLEINKRV